MQKQGVPDIECKHFAIGEIKELLDQNKIYINTDYQRGDVWRRKQKIELIRSIENRYSIGVLVLYMNDKGQYEILDGQQRLLTIKKYVDGDPDLEDADTTPYRELKGSEKYEIDAYRVYYLRLKSHNPRNKEEEIIQTFLRLQEGTPLNKAEKISAHRGLFKDTFRETRDAHPLFGLMGGDKRFRLRLLAAELLLIELETDFQNEVFPSLELKSFISALKQYDKEISKKKLQTYRGNLDLLHGSLNYLLGALKPRELISFYLLVSYLRKRRAGNKNLVNEIASFAKEFLKKLASFGIYEQKPPKGMGKQEFNKYKTYKLEAKIMTTPESLRKRFKIVLEEFKRLKPFIEKDPNRYHTEEQKRDLYFRQEGNCGFCGKPMNFRDASSDHEIAHSDGGKTVDLNHAQLLHLKCHVKLEERRKYEKVVIENTK